MIPDQPFPRERSYTCWMILLDGSLLDKAYETCSEADDEADEIMYDRDLSSIEVAEVRVTTGGTYSTGSAGLDIIDSYTLNAHNYEEPHQSIRPRSVLSLERSH